MALPLTKFSSSLGKVQRKIKKEGVLLEYISKQPELHTQTPNTDNRVDVRHAVYGLILSETQGRDGGRYVHTNEVEIILAGGQPFEPKAGDAVITPAGKRYPIDAVRKLEPDGYPIRYTLRCRDG